MASALGIATHALQTSSTKSKKVGATLHGIANNGLRATQAHCVSTIVLSGLITIGKQDYQRDGKKMLKSMEALQLCAQLTSAPGAICSRQIAASTKPRHVRVLDCILLV